MADLTSVGVTSGIPSSGTGSVATLNYLTQVGAPISNGSTSAPVTVAITGNSSFVTSSMNALVVVLSPNSSVRTQTLSSNPTVIPSSVATVSLSSNPTVIPSSAVSVTPSSAISLNSDGWTPLSAIMSSGTNSTLVKGSAASLFKVEAFNNSTMPGYLKLYNLSTAPTPGSSLVWLRFLVPGNSGGGGLVTEYSGGVTAGTGIGYTFTGGIADSDTTAVSAATYIVNIHYK